MPPVAPSSMNCWVLTPTPCCGTPSTRDSPPPTDVVMSRASVVGDHDHEVTDAHARFDREAVAGGDVDAGEVERALAHADLVLRLDVLEARGGPGLLADGTVEGDVDDRRHRQGRAHEERGQDQRRLPPTKAPRTNPRPMISGRRRARSRR